MSVDNSVGKPSFICRKLLLGSVFASDDLRFAKPLNRRTASGFEIPLPVPVLAVSERPPFSKPYMYGSRRTRYGHRRTETPTRLVLHSAGSLTEIGSFGDRLGVRLQEFCRSTIFGSAVPGRSSPFASAVAGSRDTASRLRFSMTGIRAVVSSSIPRLEQLTEP